MTVPVISSEAVTILLLDEENFRKLRDRRATYPNFQVEYPSQ